MCGENRVARLMRENELAARRKKAFRPRTTLPGQGTAPNLIKELEPNAPDQVWASDITYVCTLEGWLYLAVILDLFSRKVVGWKLGQSLEAELVVTALRNALVLRQPDQGLYFHSDRGSQYSSEAVRKPLSVIGATQSMSGVGNCLIMQRWKRSSARRKQSVFRTIRSSAAGPKHGARFSNTSRFITVTSVCTAHWDTRRRVSMKHSLNE